MHRNCQGCRRRQTPPRTEPRSARGAQRSDGATREASIRSDTRERQRMPSSEERIDERCQRSALCQNKQPAKKEQQEDHWREPELLALTHICPQLAGKTHLVPRALNLLHHRTESAKG